MKRQICTTLTGAAFASFLLVLPQMTSAAEEAEESAASAQADGAAAPAIEQLSEGMILEDKDNGKVPYSIDYCDRDFNLIVCPYDGVTKT